MTKIHRWTEIASVKKAQRQLAAAQSRLDHIQPWDKREDVERAIQSAKEYVAYATWLEEYIAAHDCTPKVTNQGEDAWGDRWATVEIDGVKYRASVTHQGNPIRIAFQRRGKNYGFHWYIGITRASDSKRIYDQRCEKSTALASTVLKVHLREVYHSLHKEVGQ